MAQQSKIKTLVGAVLALAMVAVCTLLGALTFFIVSFIVASALFDVGISLATWLNIWALLFAGAPIGFVIGLLWARGVLRRD